MDFVNRFIEYCSSSLFSSEEAQSYLLSRGSSEIQWKRHSIGYVSSPFEVDPKEDEFHSNDCFGDDFSKICDSCRYIRWSSSYEEDEDSSQKKRTIGGKIVGSITFPLTTYSGKIIGFQVRSIKEKNYDTFTLKRRPEPYFFGTSYSIHKMWDKKYVTLVEGPFDHQIFERLVDDNVLAILTNVVSQSQLVCLKRFVNKVNLCLDLDSAGLNGRKRFVDDVGSVFSINNVKFPKVKEKDKDIGDFWKSVGDVRFSKHFSKQGL